MTVARAPSTTSTNSPSSNMDRSKEDYEVGTKTADPVTEEEIDPIREKKLLRKMDLFLLPLLSVIYLLCFLDRANIGNSYTAGMAADLNLTANQKAAAVSVVYATYVTFECVWPVLIKILTVKITMAFAIMSFGAITVGTAFAKSFDHLVVCRLFLGLTEAGVFPCIVVFLSMTYKRQEMGVRLSYIFLCAALSGAFGGLIAYGLTHINSGSLASWQYIYIVEGALSMAIAPLVFFWIPNRVDRAWFLNSQEKALCTARYNSKSMHYSPDEKFAWLHIRRALMNWTTYAHGVAQFSIDTALYGISTFAPIFLKAFGFSAINSQLLTVPVYILGAISFMIQARWADKRKSRGPFILANMAVCLVGYIILAAAAGPAGLRYFALFIIAIGLYLPVGLNVGWTQANNATHYQRACSVGLMQLIGNSSGAAIGYIFMDSPRYAKGFGLASGLCVIGMGSVTLLMWYYNRENAKKRALVEAGAPDQPELGNDNPHFMYYI